MPDCNGIKERVGLRAGPLSVARLLAVSDALQSICLHCDELILASHERTRVRVAAAHHLVVTHRMSGLILEGKDFKIEAAPWRCDVCNAITEPPWWTYVTRNDEHWSAEDPLWLVCDGCQPAVEARDVRVLLQRWRAANDLDASSLDIKLMTTVAVRRQLQSFLDHIVSHRRGN